MFGFKWLAGREEKWLDFESEAIPLMENLYRTAMWLTRNQNEAEDLLQETFFQALKSFHRYEIGTNLKAWMMTIMYHLNAKRLRKMGKLVLIEDTEDKIAETIAFEPAIPQNITDEEILKALKNLPQTFRDVVVLADVEEFSYKEIASILGVPIGTIMSRLHRGRKLLRIELADYAKNFGFGNDLKIAAG